MGGICRALNRRYYLVGGNVRVIIRERVRRGASAGLREGNAHLRRSESLKSQRNRVALRLRGYFHDADALDAGEGGQRLSVGKSHVGERRHTEVNASGTNPSDEPRSADYGLSLALIEEGRDSVVISVGFQVGEFLVVLHSLDGFGVVESRVAIIVEYVPAETVYKGRDVIRSRVLVDDCVCTGGGICVCYHVLI